LDESLNISFCVKWNNMEWACFRACFPGTSRLAPAYANAHEWMFMLAHRNPMGNLQFCKYNSKMAQNSRLWCRRELWIKTLQSRFCCPRIQHDTLPHRPASNKVARPSVLTKHLLEPRSTFYVRLFHITSSNKTSFQLTPISHRIVGVNNKCSKDNRLVTA